MKISKERVIKACKARGVTRKELAEKELLIDYSTLQRLLRKGETNAERVFEIALKLSVSIAWLTGEVGNDSEIPSYNYGLTDKAKLYEMYELEKQSQEEYDAFRNYIRSMGYDRKAIEVLPPEILRTIEHEAGQYINDLFLCMGLQGNSASQFYEKQIEVLKRRLETEKQIEKIKEGAKHGKNQKTR